MFIACPRCGQQTCEVWEHECNRFVCLGSQCPEYEAQCRNPHCEYPMPKGSRAWPGGAFWAHGDYVSEQARRIWDPSINPIEPLPPPYDRNKPS